MRVLWLTWKDHAHPTAGGAEVVMRELSRRLKRDGHEVTLLTCGYTNATQRENIGGIEIIRIGTNRYAHPFQALAHYLRFLRGKFDIVIEVVNTAPYFSAFFDKKARRFLFYHQLAREIWFYETKPPLSYLGYYLLEPTANRLLSKAGASLITVSESTRKDLVRYGFRPEKIQVISEGIEFEPVTNPSAVKKYTRPTLLSLGALRAMKRTQHQIEAFELAKVHIPNLRMKIAGLVDDRYGEDVLRYIQNSKYANDIEYLGKVSLAQKLELMQRCHLITVTSVKEGWGLIVTEAASQGTPAVVYDVDGLRDSVRNGKTGLVTNPNPKALSGGIITALQDKKTYARLQSEAWQWSKQISFDTSYADFKKVLEVA